jgi:hypothetical protein
MDTPPTSVITRRGIWQIPVKQTNVLCSDGVRRVAWFTGEPDTFWTIPARVQVKGKTVRGHVYNDMEGVPCFAAYPHLKNAYVLPTWDRSTPNNES